VQKSQYNTLTADISYGNIAIYDISLHVIPDIGIPQYGIANKDTEAGMNGNEISKYLPLTESTYYILLALVEPLHGYGVMQKVEHLSEGTVKIGPGTLYGAFQALEKEHLIVKVGEEERRKIYKLTEIGLEVLKLQISRLVIMVRSGSAV
jgi:DNA-binding PadR family transcriptional regulator